ncbi:MAG: type I glyceraldehyde-3-phosphate dehydrogenase [Candidatus Diapherotrites archaeon]|nr:type I glyceraldehyde-3-phosphate dehydrogenase [Candidatus Diapherotrites archaeon]
MIRVAINGFGRIGRIVFRQALEEKEIELVAVTFSHGNQAAAHFLEFDSVHGKLNKKIEATEKGFSVNGKETLVINERDPTKLPWKKLDIDVVVESTGAFKTYADCEKHLNAGAKKVLLSAPAKDEKIPSIVLGVNEKALTDGSKVIDNASCTTNCLAPIAKVLHENFGIKNGFMTTIHAYTNDQRILDGSHKDLRRARNAATNIIPTSTGAAKAIGKVIPELKGKLNGIAVRVPVADGSLVDLVFESEKQTTIEEINKAMKKASEGNLKGILEYTEKPIVSSDVIGNKHSSIFDAQSTMVSGKMIKVLSWYDNEAGYSQRMIDAVKKIKFS